MTQFSLVSFKMLLALFAMLASCRAFEGRFGARSLSTALDVAACRRSKIASFPVSRGTVGSTRLFNTDSDDVADEAKAAANKLEEKMKSWEATDEERKAATLGGVVPERSDAFDVGLWIAFPLMVATGLIFAFFPFIMDNIDTSAVGPPPTV